VPEDFKCLKFKHRLSGSTWDRSL